MKFPFPPRALGRLLPVLALTALTGVVGVLPSCAQNPAAPVTWPTQTPWAALIAPDNSLTFNFYNGTTPVLTTSLGGWGPNWGWRSVNTKEHAQNGELDATAVFVGNKDAGEIINIAFKARQSGPNSISYQYTLSADKDVPLTFLVATVNTAKATQQGNAVLTRADGTQSTIPLSLQGRGSGGTVAQVAFHSKTVGDYDLKIEPATPVEFESAIRLVLAKDKFPAGTQTFTLTYSFPQPISFLASDADLASLTKTLPGADWFPFVPANDVGPSALGFDSWLDKPAGKHGGVRMNGDHFQFEDGTPVKFWGTNLAFGGSAPPKEQADFTAARFAKWGVNAVRMHKFTGPGWQGIGDPNDATKMTAAGLDRLDYFADQLTKNGVYYGWSHTAAFTVKPGNRDRLLAPDELLKNLGGNTYGLINVAPDLQDLLIETVVNLLQHKNPYTGLAYAQDPALCYIELQNEDDIFFYNLEGALNKAPTYKQKLVERWSDWLQQKYGSQEALKTAWGGALGGGTLAAKNIALALNPWNFSADNLPGKSGGERQRLLDNAAFLHSEQDNFYQKFVKAIRATGYAGPLVGSPWQSPSGLPHLYNLKSDAEVGYVDRHNYFGGGLNATMLKNPGSGYFSTGLQQVAGHPFGVSEWVHVYPALYSAEGPAIMAAYGMGLQGWDASYEFQSNPTKTAFADTVGTFPWGVWNTDAPTQIGQFPILARMIARGDIPQGADIAVSRVSPQDLADGKFDFSTQVKQQGDIKTFGGSVPAEALAAGRCVVEFTDKSQPSTFPDMTQYQQGDTITANNGALQWDAKAGCFTISTPGTKAVVGFAEGKEFKLGSVRVQINSPYASLFITSAERDADLTKTKTALLSAMARNANSGYSYFLPDNRPIDNGKGPILMEPVKATIAFDNRKVAAVNVLDADGKRTGRTLPVKDGQFTIDEAQEKTVYYEVVFG